MPEAIIITCHGASWAVKHNDSFIGYAKTRDEAALIGQDLAEWLESNGRCAQLVVEPRLFPHSPAVLTSMGSGSFTSSRHGRR
jgi:hypothetical protein